MPSLRREFELPVFKFFEQICLVYVNGMDSIVVLVTATASLATIGITAFYWTQDSNTSAANDEWPTTEDAEPKGGERTFTESERPDDKSNEDPPTDKCAVVATLLGQVQKALTSRKFEEIHQNVLELMMVFLPWHVLCEGLEVAGTILTTMDFVPNELQALYGIFHNVADQVANGADSDFLDDADLFHVQLAPLNIGNFLKLITDKQLHTKHMPSKMVKVIVNLLTQHLTTYHDALTQGKIYMSGEVKQLAEDLSAVSTELVSVDSPSKELEDLVSIGQTLLAAIRKKLSSVPTPSDTCAKQVEELFAGTADLDAIRKLGPCLIAALDRNKECSDLFDVLRNTTLDALNGDSLLKKIKCLSMIQDDALQLSPGSKIEQLLTAIVGEWPTVASTALITHVEYLEVYLTPYAYQIVLTPDTDVLKMSYKSLVKDVHDDIKRILEKKVDASAKRSELIKLGGCVVESLAMPDESRTQMYDVLSTGSAITVKESPVLLMVMSLLNQDLRTADPETALDSVIQSFYLAVEASKDGEWAVGAIFNPEPILTYINGAINSELIKTHNHKILLQIEPSPPNMSVVHAGMEVEAEKVLKDSADPFAAMCLFRTEAFDVAKVATYAAFAQKLRDTRILHKGLVPAAVKVMDMLEILVGEINSETINKIETLVTEASEHLDVIASDYDFKYVEEFVSYLNEWLEPHYSLVVHTPTSPHLELESLPI